MNFARPSPSHQGISSGAEFVYHLLDLRTDIPKYRAKATDPKEL